MKQRIWVIGLSGMIVVLISLFARYSKHSPVQSTAETQVKASPKVLPKPALQNIAKPLPPIVNDNTEKQATEIRQLDFEELQVQPLQKLWERWLLLQQLNQKSSLETAVLIQKLRHGGQVTKAFYKKAAALLTDAALSTTQKGALINLLGETSTPEALAILAKMLRQYQDDNLGYSIADAIARGTSGLSEWDLKPHPELSPVLESLWQQLEPDQHIAKALASRIIRLGAVSGVKLILEQLGQDGKTTAEIAQTNNPRSLAAIEAMQELRNPESLPLLKQTFQSQPLDSAAFNAIGIGLAAMGNIEATKILMDWARQAPDAAASQAHEWIGSAAANDPDSTQYLKKTLAQNNDFQSQQVKQAILDVMAERD